MGDRFHPVFIAPTFNHSSWLLRIVHQLSELGLPVIVVNDGSTDGTEGILREWSEGERLRQVVTHRRNLGKAAALLSGFERARLGGFTHGITIDTDGQHDVADVPGLLEVARENPEALVVGSRPVDSRGYPLLSRLGRRISNFLIWVEAGVRVSDSQCGLRVYPLRAIARVPAKAGRFGFETEVVTRLAWAGCEILESPVRCIYEVPGGRLSHFRPVWDSLAAVGMHGRLMVKSLSARLATETGERAGEFSRERIGAPVEASGVESSR
jgi:glycosyltransferase involved in cell wall biosynthesis